MCTNLQSSTEPNSKFHNNKSNSDSHQTLMSANMISSNSLLPATTSVNDRHSYRNDNVIRNCNGNSYVKVNGNNAQNKLQHFRCKDAGIDDNFLTTSVHFSNKRLCYSGQRCSKIPEVIVKLYSEKANSLDLSYNDLVTTRGLERFVHLRELVLDNNQLNDNITIPYLPYLHTLSLNKNLINDIELLTDKLSKSLPALNFLSLLGNKACPNQLSDIENDDIDYARYRCYVLSRLPNLEFLDSTRISAQERQLAEQRGQFMKVIRPKDDDYGVEGGSRESTQDDSPPNSYYSPLPRNIRRPDDHKGAYSRCKYKYSGKHSEGNRFISNNDL